MSIILVQEQKLLARYGVFDVFHGADSFKLFILQKAGTGVKGVLNDVLVEQRVVFESDYVESGGIVSHQLDQRFAHHSRDTVNRFLNTYGASPSQHDPSIAILFRPLREYFELAIA